MNRRDCSGDSCRRTSVWVALVVFVSVCISAPAGQAAHVTINEDGVLLIDGRKILPIGFTGGPPPGGRTPDGKSAFEEIRAAGGTFFRTGPQGGDSWNEATLAQEQIQMDAAARHGLYCWPRLENLSSLREDDVCEERSWRRYAAARSDFQ
ncbi:MAG: hypothetical protein FJ280_19380 [Planctomycetes bacterium]|nr:hypothetical protein [Planctomycetota bacterium]